MLNDLESAREYASLGGSAIALLSTLYFWLVRSNRERGRLAVHPIGNLRGTGLTAMDDVDIYRRLKPDEKEICLKYWLHVAIVNNSTLPNAILTARVWLKFADGLWREMDVRHQSADKELFPANIDPLTTVSLPMALAGKVIGELGGGFAQRETAAGDALPDRVLMRIELQGLQNRVYRQECVDAGSDLRRTAAKVPLTAAA